MAHGYQNYGPFKVLDMDRIESSWYQALIPAYNYNWDQLNQDLQRLDQEIAYSDWFCKLNPDLDSLFAWTFATPLYKARVIIVANQPTNQVTGSGIAFHPLDNGSVSTSLRNIFYQMPYYFNVPHPDRNGDFSLKGWIEQGVVLVNAMTSKDRRPNAREHSAWLPIMDKLLNYIFDTKGHVHFILLGNRTRDEFLQGRYSDFNNRIQLAHHPSYGYQKNDPRFISFGQALKNIDDWGIVDFTRLNMWNYC